MNTGKNEYGVKTVSESLLSEEIMKREKILDQKRSDQRKLIERLSWFDSTDIGSLFSSLENDEKSKANIASLLGSINSEIAEITKNIQDTNAQVNSFFNPKNWFDDSQRHFRKRRGELQNNLKTKEDYLAKREEELEDIENGINKIKIDIDRYKDLAEKPPEEDIKKLTKQFEEQFIRKS